MEGATEAALRPSVAEEEVVVASPRSSAKSVETVAAVEEDGRCAKPDLRNAGIGAAVAATEPKGNGLNSRIAASSASR